jgi:hypothetical protein
MAPRPRYAQNFWIRAWQGLRSIREPCRELAGGSDISVKALFRRSRGEAERLEGDEMRRVIVNEWMTLDGVVQAPSYADEDRTGASSAAAGTPATSMIFP